MSTTITIEKNLICEQDMLLGRESKQQQRAGTTVIANPLRLLAVVDSIEQLKTLSTDRYDFAFIRQDFPVTEGEQEPEPEPALLPGMNEFYALDYSSTENEKIPSIVQPNETVVGRWKRIVIGEASVKALIIEEVDKVKKSLEAEIDEKLQTALEVQVPQEIANALLSLTVKGFEFDENLKYKQNDYVRAFVRSKGVITERLYMVDKATASPEDEIDYAPLQGDNYRDINGTLIYEDNSNLQEQEGYARVYTVEGLKKTFRVSQGSNYKLYEPSGAVYPKGVLKVRALKSGKVSGYFEITFGGTSHTDFSFRNVMYSKSVRSAAATSSLGYIFYPGFAAYCDETYFGISVASTTYVDSFELDYTDIDLVPSASSSSYVTNKCYALREGGGSYIPNIGSTFFSMRRAGASSSGDSEDFFNFMSGSIPWTNGISVDDTLYHQYAASCVKPTMDASGRIVQNLKGGKSVGALQEETLPNVKSEFPFIRGAWSSRSVYTNIAVIDYQNSSSNSSPQPMEVFPSGTIFDYEWKTPNDVMGRVGGYDIYGTAGSGQFNFLNSCYLNGSKYYPFPNLSLARVNSVYQDGASVNQKAVYQQCRLQLF